MNIDSALKELISVISSLPGVCSIGMSGGNRPLPNPGEGDIDVFIYCSEIPMLITRVLVLDRVKNMISDLNPNVFQNGHWGTGDALKLLGVETWLMYFTVEEMLTELDSTLQGQNPDKVDNYYYPIGRCAMLRDIKPLYDPDNFLNTLKIRLLEYSESLAARLLNHHLEKLNDKEDLERAILRKDVLFYHFAIDIALDHFLQALFAVNKVYFPSRKRSLEYINDFKYKPVNCSQRLLNIVQYGGCKQSLEKSLKIWLELLQEFKEIAKDSK